MIISPHGEHMGALRRIDAWCTLFVIHGVVMVLPSVNNDVGSRHRKAEIDLRLYVNGVSYEFEKLCEFCESGPATKHCPDEVCGFMCDDCDVYRHETSGSVTSASYYERHKRAQMSKFDIPSAAFKIKGFMRYIYHRGRMREEIRRQYSRFFNGRARRHFYLFHRTGEVSWAKPRPLGSEELRPFLTLDEAAFKIQQLHRNWKAREVARQAMRREWTRVFYPQEMIFYFYYEGRSPLILPERATWIQPCRFIGGIWVWRPWVTTDLAAFRIQNLWRCFAERRRLRARARQVFELQRDPITGAEEYRNTSTDEILPRKPLVLGSERWDLDEMLEWSVEEVVMFIRRCGLKRYTPRFRYFNVDGALLMTFDPEDFRLLGVKNPVLVKKILLGIERRAAFSGYNERSNDRIRRAALRQRYFEDTQAEKIQRWWRDIWGIMLRRNWKQTLHAARIKAGRDREVKESSRWWTEKLRDYSGIDPSIKMFGRRGIVLGTRGWGHWDALGRQWTPAPEEVGAPHISRVMYREHGDSAAAIPVHIMNKRQ